MEFLKALFANGEALTFDQLVEKAKAAKINAVNLADGGYVSQDKYNDKVTSLSQQVTDLQGQLTQRDTDMAALKTTLTAAQADASKLGEAQQALTDLQTKYDADKQGFEQKLSQQAYEFAIREKANGLQFSSGSAKKAFIQEAIGKGFKMDGDTILGYEDFVTKYKEEDPGTFKAEEPADGSNGGGKGKPDIVLPNGGGKPSGGGSDLFQFAFNGVRPIPKN